MLSCLAVSSAYANSHLIDVPQCPEVLTVRQNAEIPSDGWQAFNTNGQHGLDMVYISHEPDPREFPYSFYKADNYKKLPNGNELFYYDTLNVDEANVSWVLCGYKKSEAILARKLPSNAKRCEVEHSNQNRFTLRCFDKTRPEPKFQK